MDIDAVQERPADSGAVSLDLWRCAPAFSALIAQITAGAGVHGGHQHEGAGQGDLARAAGNGDISILQWLAEDFQGRALELR